MTPACVFAQRLRGRWIVFDELVAEDMGIVRFSEIMKQHMAQYLPREFIIYGDPAGDQEYKQMNQHHFKYYVVVV